MRNNPPLSYDGAMEAEKMKTLVFFGSPRRQGNTRKLVDACMESFKGEVLTVDCCSGRISACTDCRWCRRHAGCSIHDDMDAIYPWVEEADAVIIASPVHMGTLSGPLLSVLSRLQTYWSSKFIRTENKVVPRKKAGALLLTAGSTDPGMENSSIYAASFAFKLMNAEPLGTVLAMDTDHITVGKNKAVLASVRLLGEEVALWRERSYRARETGKIQE